MKIAIDARFINPENRGLSTYTRNLVFGLEHIDKKNQYYILLRNKDCATLKFHNPRFKKIKAESHWYGIKEQFLIPFILHKIKPDLTHFPHFNVPMIYNRPFITTIHDLILFAYPTKRASTLSTLTYTVKNRAYRAVIKHAVSKSKSIIAVSQSTSRDIQKFFPRIDSRKVTTIYEGADEDIFFSSAYKNSSLGKIGEWANPLWQDRKSFSTNKYKKISRKKRQEWLSERISIKFPFIFYLGGAYPHKNLERLILAFKQVQKKRLAAPVKTGKHSNELNLVIAGGEDYFFNRLKTSVKRKNIPNVIFPGFVADRKTLEFLYQEALFCIFPSLYEGFGLPPLEALKREKLVLCNNGTCFPEILGNSVIYFNGKSVTDIGNSIIGTVKNLKSLKKTYLPKASKTLARYSWRKMAQETLVLYKKAARK